MKRILTTTAIVLAMTGAAHAQDAVAGFGDVEYQQGDFYASDLIGMRIYNSESEMESDATITDGAEKEWDDIGEINDIIVTKDGKVSAVVLGVGGFLGIGERDVTVSMDEITVVREEGDSDDRFLVVSTSKEALEAAPAFERDMSGEEEGMKAKKTQADMEQTEEAKAAEVTADPDMKTGSDMKADENAEMKADDAEMKADNEMASDNTATDTMATDSMATDDRAMNRPMLTRPAVEREGYTEVKMEEVRQMTSDDLEDAPVYGANDEDVGEIDSLVLGDDGKVSEVVINVGGFLGLGEKSVAVTFDELQILQEEGGDDLRIYIDSTEEALEAQPEFEG